jgi:hypothetical protein
MQAVLDIVRQIEGKLKVKDIDILLRLVDTPGKSYEELAATEYYRHYVEILRRYNPANLEDAQNAVAEIFQMYHRVSLCEAPLRRLRVEIFDILDLLEHEKALVKRAEIKLVEPLKEF